LPIALSETPKTDCSAIGRILVTCICKCRFAKRFVPFKRRIQMQIKLDKERVPKYKVFYFVVKATNSDENKNTGVF